MTIRITGMNSGLDTESIINELASARSVKVQKIEKNQTKLSWEDRCMERTEHKDLFPVLGCDQRYAL